MYCLKSCLVWGKMSTLEFKFNMIGKSNQKWAKTNNTELKMAEDVRDVLQFVWVAARVVFHVRVRVGLESDWNLQRRIFAPKWTSATFKPLPNKLIRLRLSQPYKSLSVFHCVQERWNLESTWLSRAGTTVIMHFVSTGSVGQSWREQLQQLEVCQSPCCRECRVDPPWRHPLVWTGSSSTCFGSLAFRNLKGRFFLTGGAGGEKCSSRTLKKHVHCDLNVRTFYPAGWKHRCGRVSYKVRLLG